MDAEAALFIALCVFWFCVFNRPTPRRDPSYYPGQDAARAQLRRELWERQRQYQEERDEKERTHRDEMSERSYQLWKDEQEYQKQARKHQRHVDEHVMRTSMELDRQMQDLQMAYIHRKANRQFT